VHPTTALDQIGDNEPSAVLTMPVEDNMLFDQQLLLFRSAVLKREF
jgi:hypothetical protein